MKNLYTKIKAGDKEAINELGDELYRRAIIKLENENDAKDVVQETFLSALLNIDTLEDTKLFKEWIIRILYNKCNDIYRRKYADDKAGEILYAYEQVEYDWLEHAGEVEFKKNPLLKNCNEMEKEVAYLHYEKDYPIKTISKKLKMKESNVKSNLHRARDKAKKLLMVLLLVTVAGSGINLGTYYKSMLKEKVKVMQVISTDAIDDAKEDKFMQKINEQFVYSNNIGIKVDSVAMDDKLLYISYMLDFKDKAIKDINFEDYVITDNKNNLLSIGISDWMDNKYTKDYSSGGVTYESETIKNEDGKWSYSTTFQVIYDKDYPCSDIINLNINKLSVLVDGKREIYEGDWNFQIDLEEKFSKRSHIDYEHTPNDKIKNINARLNDLSLELEVEFNEKINANVISSNELIIQNSKQEPISTYLKVINPSQNKVSYVCDVGKFSENIDTLNFYIKFNYGNDNFVDVTLK